MDWHRFRYRMEPWWNACTSTAATASKIQSEDVFKSFTSISSLFHMSCNVLLLLLCLFYYYYYVLLSWQSSSHAIELLPGQRACRKCRCFAWCIWTFRTETPSVQHRYFLIICIPDVYTGIHKKYLTKTQSSVFPCSRTSFLYSYSCIQFQKIH